MLRKLIYEYLAYFHPNIYTYNLTHYSRFHIDIFYEEDKIFCIRKTVSLLSSLINAYYRIFIVMFERYVEHKNIKKKKKLKQKQ